MTADKTAAILFVHRTEVFLSFSKLMIQKPLGVHWYSLDLTITLHVSLFFSDILLVLSLQKKFSKV